MGWQDPSPRARVRSPAGEPAAQPGYGVARVSSGRLLFRLALAVAAGALAGGVAKWSLAAWHGRASGFDLALALAAALVAAALAWQYLAYRPATRGLGARVRDGDAGWRQGPDSGTVDALIVADAVTDLAGAVADIAGDVLADL